jgi:hypothetical protein
LENWKTFRQANSQNFHVVVAMASKRKSNDETAEDPEPEGEATAAKTKKPAKAGTAKRKKRVIALEVPRH